MRPLLLAKLVPGEGPREMLSGSRQGKERRASPCIAAFVTVEAEVQDGIRVTLLNDVYSLSDGAV